VLQREHRLRAKSDFERVKREGKRWRSEWFSLSVFAHHAGPTRFGFVVSKRVAAKASARNLIKRRLRAIIQGLLARILPGFDIVIVAQSAEIAADFHALAELVRRVLDQAGTLAAGSESLS
jgi:ribonuclease P protein component